MVQEHSKLEILPAAERISMRRLAQQSRDDVYASRRDYQTIHTARGQRFAVGSAGPHVLKFAVEDPAGQDPGLVGAGLYVLPSESVPFALSVTSDGSESHKSFAIGGGHWNRIGVLTEADSTLTVSVRVEWSGQVDITIWGLTAGRLRLPEVIFEVASVDELRQSHLAPETFYFQHDQAIGIDLVGDMTGIEMAGGSEISLKKCSYCGRQLPLDPNRLGTLAFHKHNAKISNHQNECRACKKWRINNDFNPKRTVDQLHESSVITRERKLFLREPERLQAVKDRTGAGLKSQVWERFDRKCFYCGRTLNLGEVQLDHTRPLAYLWPIDEHATCLCAEHNNQKKDKFPIDFYTSEQLVELSRITGLALPTLTKKEINMRELARIRKDITAFAQEWQARTFAATARKIVEYHPDIDLFDDLKKADPDVHDALMEELATRPPGVED
ncbi:HNH endonuclease [Mycobacteroides abscessus]|uniref:HNH endonuclease n=1 Tax=Mycobacteroides abscessus TaxID=36809 RepID=UPI000D3ED399|nr:HNH endonuclease signature motif containing protein [Mycobacteroides abscessus]PVB05048.1 hypothetical protein DDJ47_07380 [Mycobacteroides abscessus]RIT46030.1 HNH endonuclease [Mycobacteroides abscessus]